MNRHTIPRWIWLAAGLAFALVALPAETIRARWALEASEAVVGQGLTLTLEVQGTDQLKPPTLRIPGVEVQWLGSRPNNSTSMVSINGRTTTTVTKSVVAGWSLKAGQPGRYHLDAQDLDIAGQAIRLGALDWTVNPVESDSRFFLKQSLGQTAAIPGVEIEYRLVWYLGQSAQKPEFSLPILDNPQLEVVEDSLKPPSGEVFQIEYRGRALTGLKSTEKVGGQQYATLTFRFRVKANQPGDYDLSGTRVTFSGAVATRQTQDFFGNIVDEPAYKTIAAQAGPLVLHVKELPAQGRPAVFSGLIGKLKLSWSGLQGPYRVGEPIRLGLKLEGVQNKPNLDLDAMVTQALADPDFQIVPDPASQSDSDGERGYVVRARHGGKLVIPSLKLNYFDPAANAYGETATPALSIDILDAPAGAAANLATIAGPEAAPGSKGGAAMNPQGLPGARLSVFPWWAWALPQTLAGLVLAGLGLWRHSRRRHLKLARLAWQAGLVPLESMEARGQLEEARQRLQGLLGAGGLWRQRLEETGHLDRLRGMAADWDLAFFAKGRESEPWQERWATFCNEARGWK